MRWSSAMLRADCLLGVARQLRQEGRHAASTEVEEPRPYRLDGDTCHLVVHRPDLALELRHLVCAQYLRRCRDVLVANAVTMSTLASPRTRSALASVGVSPTSIVIATLGRDDRAFTLGAVAAVQTTIWFRSSRSRSGLLAGSRLIRCRRAGAASRRRAGSAHRDARALR
jgi:hypothetical protein